MKFSSYVNFKHYGKPDHISDKRWNAMKIWFEERQKDKDWVPEELCFVKKEKDSNNEHES